VAEQRIDTGRDHSSVLPRERLAEARIASSIGEGGGDTHARRLEGPRKLGAGSIRALATPAKRGEQGVDRVTTDEVGDASLAKACECALAPGAIVVRESIETGAERIEGTSSHSLLLFLGTEKPIDDLRRLGAGKSQDQGRLEPRSTETNPLPQRPITARKWDEMSALRRA
jgi:hypothetical protein